MSKPIDELIERLKRMRALEEGRQTRRALTMCAKYLQALNEAGEFEEPRFLSPGTYWEET